MRRFATSEVAEDLQRSGFALGGKRVHGTVMFCDIRGFTSIVEQQTPEETIELLNTYYTLMFDAISGARRRGQPDGRRRPDGHLRRAAAAGRRTAAARCARRWR